MINMLVYADDEHDEFFEHAQSITANIYIHLMN